MKFTRKQKRKIQAVAKTVFWSITGFVLLLATALSASVWIETLTRQGLL